MIEPRREAARRLAGAVLAALALTLGAATAPARADPADTAEVSALDADYAAGRQAIETRNWTVAVQRLEQAERRYPDNADLHNYLGYAYRNLGRYDAALGHYRRAIALDPRHRGAHEYIGETYLIIGDLPAAERHLAALREICLLPCEELLDLQTAIAAWRAEKVPH